LIVSALIELEDAMRTVLIAAVLLVGCGGPVVCKDRSGSYTLTHSRRSGDCGEIPELVIAPGGEASDCTGEPVFSEDNCEVTMNTICGPTKATGKVTWNADGTEGSGVMQYTYKEGADYCIGTYDVRYRQL
jgi:hypothetical protein